MFPIRGERQVKHCSSLPRACLGKGWDIQKPVRFKSSTSTES